MALSIKSRCLEQVVYGSEEPSDIRVLSWKVGITVGRIASRRPIHAYCSPRACTSITVRPVGINERELAAQQLQHSVQTHGRIEQQC